MAYRIQPVVKTLLFGNLDGYLLFDDRTFSLIIRLDRYHEPTELVERHRAQLELYAEALSRSYGLGQISI